MTIDQKIHEIFVNNINNKLSQELITGMTAHVQNRIGEIVSEAEARVRQELASKGATDEQT